MGIDTEKIRRILQDIQNDIYKDSQVSMDKENFVFSTNKLRKDIVKIYNLLNVDRVVIKRK